MIKVYETSNATVAVPFVEIDLIEVTKTEDGCKVTIYDNEANPTEIIASFPNADSQ